MSTSLQYIGKEKRERKSVVVDQVLETIYKKQKSVTAEAVLAEATKPDHPLHSYFVWDNTEAANKYRLAQAYALIIGSKFVVQLIENGKSVPKQIKGTANVRRLVSAFRGEGFRMRTDALKDAASRTAIIETKRSQLRSWCDSTIDIEELDGLRKKILAEL